jgi:hypothetical protein
VNTHFFFLQSCTKDSILASREYHCFLSKFALVKNGLSGSDLFRNEWGSISISFVDDSRNLHKISLYFGITFIFFMRNDL